MDTLTATGSSSTNGKPANGKPPRGKDQLNWSDDVWDMIDQATSEEITRSRMGAKFLPSVYVHKKRTTVDADIVVPPANPATDPSLSIEEATTKRIQQYNAQIRLSRAQMEAEGEHDADLVAQIAAKPNSSASGAVATSSSVRRPHRASTAVSLALQAAKLLAQVEDLVLFNGASAVAYHPLFTTNLVQSLDPNLLTNLDGGLLNILPSTSTTNFQPATPATGIKSAVNVVQLPASQIVCVHPSESAAVTGSLPRYAENSLNAAAQAVAILQGLGYNDNYAMVLHTVPYADLHEALKDTLIQPVEPISHLITSGIYGTGNLPPFPNTDPSFSASTPPANTGLPTYILTPGAGAGGAVVLAVPPIVTTASTTGTAISQISSGTLSGFTSPATGVVYTGFVISLSGNSVDVVRGLMDDGLDVCLTFNQKSASEFYIFNEAQRFCLRLKDQNAVVALFFLDQ